MIDSVSGMSTSVRNAGTISSSASKGNVRDVRNMSTPTTMSTGAVAYAGTMAASGARNRHGTKQSAVTTAVSPERPPALMPAALST